MSALEPFHPLIQRWFNQRFPAPTDVQAQAWPPISRGEHVLVTAPTGSGKTLTAFLWGINRFATGELRPGRLGILYVSPLKALNNDVSRNLVEPITALGALFAAEGVDFPRIRVATRSGDTSPQERRHQLRQPPEILVTTPESLHVLLSSSGGERMLMGVDTVVLDEIHSIAGDRRGTLLMTAVERLALVSGEFQRIALSATVRPAERIARWVGGHRLAPDAASGTDPAYLARQVRLIGSQAPKGYDLQVRTLEVPVPAPAESTHWQRLADEIRSRLGGQRSTLVFTNSRALCERLTLLINQGAGRMLAYAHHGSLARELRLQVEEELKAGRLAAIVATSSLELGIDIGALDEVLLVQSPSSVAATIQRIGRAGHAVGEISRAIFYPSHPADALQAAVLAAAVIDGDIAELTPLNCPLDVLAQVLVSMAATRDWRLDEMFNWIRATDTYNRLPRAHFDRVIDMLSGRYQETRIRELEPRLALDRLDGLVAIRPGARQQLFLSGGVIPNRGYYQIRLEDSDARVGELDEEFVWESRPGKVFTLGTSAWRIARITHNEVLVRPAGQAAGAPPFWRSESVNRDFHLSQRIGALLEEFDADPAAGEALLRSRHQMEPVAAADLAGHLRRQREHTGTGLPHRHHLLIEQIQTGPGGAAGHQWVIHTHWGGRVNRPFGLALEAAWRRATGEQIDIHVTDDALALPLVRDADPARLLGLVPAGSIEELLRDRLESSGFFGARFRECAGRALLIGKGRFGERKPLWMSRLQSQKLLDAVMGYADFPMVIEAWRTCLADEFDLPHLEQLLDELAAGRIRWTHVVTASPSPMAQALAFSQINDYMYMDDSLRSGRRSAVDGDLIAELVQTTGARPAVPAALIAEFEAKLQRTHPGYSPASPQELLEHLKARRLIPQAEWALLLQRRHSDHGLAADADLPGSFATRVVLLSLAGRESVAALESLAWLQRALAGTSAALSLRLLSGQPLPTESATPGEDALAELIASLLEFYGPMPAERLEALFGLPAAKTAPALQTLTESGRLRAGRLIRDTGLTCWCDGENYETLLRLARRRAVPATEPLALARLTPFLRAWQQHRSASSDPMDLLLGAIENLQGHVCGAERWEAELLPARVPGYQTAWLDQLFDAGGVLWQGHPGGKLTLAFLEDLPLLRSDRGRTAPSPLPPGPGRYELTALADSCGQRVSELNAALWEAAWHGEVSNDRFQVLRRGLELGFDAPLALAPAGPGRGLRRGGFNRWQAAVSGHWFRLPSAVRAEDPLADIEAQKARVRILLDRYGILFRELLQREVATLQWRNLFRALRLMELAGEVVSGPFFADLPGPQFMDPSALALLQQDPSPHGFYWLSALDPIAPTGLELPAFKPLRPRRAAGTHLVYKGPELVAVAESYGRRLRVLLPPEDASIDECWISLRHLLERPFQPRRELKVESINGQAAATSPFVASLARCFHLVREGRALSLRRRQL